jgi:hypothetical protein
MIALQFVAQWVKNFGEHCRGSYWAGGNLLALITFLAATSRVIPLVWMLIPAPIFLWSLVVTLPTNFMSLRHAMNQELTLSEITGVVPTPDYHVGLVGIAATGKSSFRGSLANRRELPATTENVVEIVSLPDAKEGNVTVAIYDSVGQNFDAMFQIARAVPILILFIDHSPSATDPKLNLARQAEHTTFVTQLSRVLERLHGPKPSVWIVTSKHDLLVLNTHSLQRMRSQSDRFRAQLAKAVGGIWSHSLQDYSNRIGGDATRLLNRVVDAK